MGLNRFLILGAALWLIIAVCRTLSSNPMVLAGQFLERLALGLWDKQRREDTTKPNCYKE